MVVKSTLSYPLIITSALAFIHEQESNPYQETLRAIFGRYSLRWFCVDMMDTTALVTFSMAEKPGLLTREGKPVQVHTKDADYFRLYFSEAVAIRSGRLLTPGDNLSACMSVTPEISPDALDNED